MIKFTPRNSLDSPPYLQLAVDVPYLSNVKKLLSNISNSVDNQLLYELGTPLIKNAGLVNLTPIYKEKHPDAYLIADLKTLDVGQLEVTLAKESKVDACVVSGLAPQATINSFLDACSENNIDGWIDSLGLSISNLIVKIDSCTTKPKVIILHRGIDEELSGKKTVLDNIKAVKEKFDSLVAVAGGLTTSNVKIALENGADIIIVGRAIYQSDNPEKVIQEFLDRFK